MAEHQTTVFRGPETPEAFLADRQRFWDAWTHFTTAAVVFLVVLLVAMAVFLL
jgi:hypothetical protein